MEEDGLRGSKGYICNNVVQISVGSASDDDFWVGSVNFIGMKEHEDY
jgi:hypothetical protein